MKELENLKEMYLDEIKKINKKGELTPTDAEAAKKALEAITMIDMICDKMEDDDTYSERSYRRNQSGNNMSRHYPMPDMGYGYGYDDGRYSSRYSSRRGRGSNGRYVSRSGDGVDSMIRKLENMKMEAPDDETRYAIDLTIEKLENY